MKIEINNKELTEEIRELKPFFGRYFLRDGDLHAERIDMWVIMKYQYTPRFLDDLWKKGLLFNTLEDAENVRRCMLGAVKTINECKGKKNAVEP